MCGIIGYSGFRDSKKVLLNGLERLEYRGYDSMGLIMSTKSGFSPSDLIHIRSVGNVQRLRAKLKGVEATAGEGGSAYSSWGLAHSRWATHGAPSERNAHPHRAGPFYIVHNGIIENAEELKAWLKGPFVSETDSEVVAHCLWDSYQKTGSLKEAVFDTMTKIRGEYAVAVLSEKHPGELFGFKKGPSLLVGVGEGEMFLCSDIQGVLPYTKKAVFLRDGEVAHIKDKNTWHIYCDKKEVDKKEMKKKEVDKKDRVTVLSAKAQDSEKRGYPYYMLKEIYDQPECARAVIQNYVNKKKLAVEFTPDLADLKVLQGIVKDRLYLSACGSSYYAALYGKYVIEKLSRVPVEVDMSSEFRYRSPVLPKGAPVLLISQSGETADTLAVMRMAQSFDLPVVSLCNVAHSSLDRDALVRLYMFAGVEKGVASTKAFTSTLLTLFLLAVFLGRQSGRLSADREKECVRSVLRVPSLMEEILSREEYTSCVHLAGSLKSFIYLGRDVFYPVALEGALKMKELSYRHASAYPAGEMKHGPLALVEESTAVVGLAPQSPVRQKTLANLKEALCRGGKLILIGTKGDEEARALCPEHFLSVPLCDEPLSAILSVLPVQLMAYHTACALGHNVDQPRNLAKSVTVE